MVRAMKKKHEGSASKSDRHTTKGILVRLHPEILAQLEKLCGRTKNKRTQQIQIAVREHLEREGLWPVRDGDELHFRK